MVVSTSFVLRVVTDPFPLWSAPFLVDPPTHGFGSFLACLVPCLEIVMRGSPPTVVCDDSTFPRLNFPHERMRSLFLALLSTLTSELLFPVIICSRGSRIALRSFFQWREPVVLARMLLL